ncbi:hypothetical protein PJ985_03155 [Streptomyces sp. ACA25]|uniref:hypothetical protein n=1 Tax=Streptomyces sp. ACA25 TaxID=3022596 RepID=UPI002307CFA2|nr:hypothetical protein [Streptomyces sp. ACA25]MDB1086564.1 hypothetical protein [Streptomyces sp. ACA25]
MSDLTTRVIDPQAPVHTGSGDQYNLLVHTLTEDSRGRSPRRYAEDQLRLLTQRFVYPTGFSEARRILAGTSTVLLDGVPGSGRTSAARILLHELHRTTGMFHELVADDQDRSVLDPALVGAGDRLLLDLSAAQEPQWDAVRTELSSFRETVRDQGAHLVVVMPRHRGGRLEADLSPYHAEILRPPAKEVLRRYLRTEGVPLDRTDQPAPALDDFLAEERPMREVAQFAGYVVKAQAAGTSGTGFAAWCESARATLTDRGPQVARWVAALPEGPQRALLLSTAMLHGAHPDIVDRGTTVLLRTLKHPEDERPLLARADLSERFGALSVGLDPAGRVRFRELDQDAAVRAHFWDHMPDLRPHLCTWAGRTVDLADPFFSPAERDRLVERLTSQYLRTGRWDGVASLAEQWTAPPTTARRMRAAAQALVHGLRDEKHGQPLRQKIYHWSLSGQLRAELAQVLVEVCAQEIAVHHPDQAMVRLHHLAHRERDTRRAQDALCRLVDTHHRLRRRMLYRIAEGREHVRAEDLGLFLRIADPGPLHASWGNGRSLLMEAAVRGWLITGWASVFGDLPVTAWQAPATRWLHAACGTDGRHRELLLDVLVAGAGHRGEVYARLYRLARQAEPSAPEGPGQGSEITELLLSKISAAQELRARATPSQPSRETAP